MTTKQPSLHPAVREHVEHLTSLQEREGVYLLSQLNGGIFDEPPLSATKILADRIQQCLAENIAQLSHGLSASYRDGAIEIPWRGAASGVSGAAATAAAYASERPASATMRHVSTALAGILADYTILYTLALAASNEPLVEICLRHLQRIRTFGDALLTTFPVAVAYEFSATEERLSTVDTGAAQQHLEEIIGA